jgi:sterol desaturase/sphingolipid hydroxylase (fatty acid hydroxylase superfamily)
VLNPIVLSIPIFFILIGIEIIYDRITHKHLYRLNDAVSNISCGIFEQITGVFAKVFTVALYAVIYDHFRLFTVPSDWYWLVILFLGVDLCYYWAHRMSHEINLFWSGHVVHHQSEEYNLSVALRQGALQKIFTSFFYLPLAILGFKTEWFLLLAAYNTLYQFWIHTEAIRSLGPLEYIFNTPSHHRVHHGRNPKYIDRNHAGTLIIWDKLFGTFQKEEERVVYGITTPTQCWDPVSAHLRPFTNLWLDFKLVKEWPGKIRLLFMKPGWLPEKYGGYRAPKEVMPESYEKFETKVNHEMNWYLLVHFILILAGASFFLFGLEQLSKTEQIVYTVLISFSIMSTGFLFEGKKWAGVVEIIRLVVAGIILYYFFSDASFHVILSVLLILVTGFSVFWLNRFYLQTRSSTQITAINS